jgi:hypothetical protein
MFQKISLFALLGGAVFFTQFASAQSLQIVDADSVVYGNAHTTIDMASHIKLKNVSNRSLNVHVKRLDKNYNALTDSNAICWGICYTPATSQTPFASPVVPDSVYEEFSGHVYPDLNGVVLSGPITYVFFDENNPTDSVAHTIYYTLTADFSVGESEALNISVYPNPAKEVLNVEAKQEGLADKLCIRNLDGRLVKEVDLRGVVSTQINVQTLPKGVYMYTLLKKGATLLANKLVIE